MSLVLNSVGSNCRLKVPDREGRQESQGCGEMQLRPMCHVDYCKEQAQALLLGCRLTALYTRTFFRVCVEKFVVFQFIYLCYLFNLTMPASKQFPCWLINGACWRQNYLQLRLTLTRSVSRLKKQQTLLIPSIAFSNKSTSLA